MARSGATDPFASDDADTFLTVLFLLVAKCGWVVIRFWVFVIKWAVLFPMVSIPVLAALLALDLDGPWDALFLTCFTIALLLLWWWLGPVSFRDLFTGRVRNRWRKWHTYTTRWAQACALHGLAPVLDKEPVVPKLRRVRIGQNVDELAVNLVFGQALSDWSSQAEALAHSFGAQSATAVFDRPGRIKIVLRRLDRLVDPLPLLPPALHPDLESVTIGQAENGAPWNVRIQGRHLLVAGVTGSGKGSVVWSILSGIAPLIADGTVQAWTIDPKGGMEFGMGVALFTRFASDTRDGALGLLRDAAEILTRRANLLRGTSRLHVPTPGDPLILVVIDEIASLVAYQTDRKVAAEISQLLALILSQGRAVGVVVIATVQDPSKDTLAFRQLFPTRIGMRLSEASQVDMVLGAGARAAGALCDQIPDRLPGVAFVMEDGSATPMRARAFHVTDQDIQHLADTYTPPTDVPEDGPSPVRFLDALTPTRQDVEAVEP